MMKFRIYNMTDHEMEEWLSANSAEISAKIAEGHASEMHGELIDADQVRAWMAEKKRIWRLERGCG